MSESHLAFVHSGSPAAIEAHAALVDLYEQCAPEQADVIIALGGDGFILQCLHEYLALDTPIYGMNRGTVGFLLNEFESTGLPARVAAARGEVLHPLRMWATDEHGVIHEALAFNEVSVLRSTRQSANLRLVVDGASQMDKLICDGVLVATAAGSTAYNLSAHGPVVPVGSDLMALTAISPFRPRRWRGALLPSDVEVLIENLDPDKRPVGVAADHTEVQCVVSVRVAQALEHSSTLLFDPGRSLNERILREQFAH